MDISEIEYMGIDCVPEMIRKNQSVFAQYSNMRFSVADVVTDSLPKVELIICRDVLHYLPNEMIWQFNNINSQYMNHLKRIQEYKPLAANTPRDTILSSNS